MQQKRGFPILYSKHYPEMSRTDLGYDENFVCKFFSSNSFICVKKNTCEMVELFQTFEMI